MEQAQTITMKMIAKIHTDFPSKFGIPRQSGLVEELVGEIIFEPEFRRTQALLGMEEFSHLWILWGFSANPKENWSPTVYPPRLGGKEKRGVFATRASYRPNPIALSCVKLERVIWEGANAPKLMISGIDMMDGTPIYDIKPYLPYADCKPQATGGFGQAHKEDGIEVVFPKELLHKLPPKKQQAAIRVLQQDPRAAYNKQPGYVYGMEFAGFDIRFTVSDDKLNVCEVISTHGNEWLKVK